MNYWPIFSDPEMNLQQAIHTVVERRDLSADQMASVMRSIMTGEATPAQIGGFLIGLRMKGETVDEIVAAATVMRELATPVAVDKTHLVDTCGTGGDTIGTFNISTACAFVAAAAGARVAKHGNRSVSSRSGSADVLEAAGVNLKLTPEQVAHCIENVGVGFLFAPLHHGAMKYAIGPRKEMGVRSVFNLLGPLTNPAAAPNQVIGVFSPEWLKPLAQVLAKLGSRHVMVIHAEDGLDEISVAAPTHVAELIQGTVKTYRISPADFGLRTSELTALKVDTAEQSLALIREVLSGRDQGPARDIVCLNAGAAIYVAGLVKDLHSGVIQARDLISKGEGERKLAALIRYTQAT